MIIISDKSMNQIYGRGVPELDIQLDIFIQIT